MSFFPEATIRLTSIDSLYCSLDCEDFDVRKNIEEEFTYQMPGYQFTPAHRRFKWDGMISIYDPASDIFPNGSVAALKRLCDRNNWRIIDDRDRVSYNLTEDEAQEFYETLNLNNYKVREHQDRAFRSIISDDGNGFYISPTSSGKSFIAFLVARFMYEMTGQKTLVVVPSVHLVGQMANDFQSYTTDKLEIKKIQAGVSKYNIKEPYVITTWKSIVDMEPEWFDQYSCFIGDEGHGFTAGSLKTIVSKTGNIPLRFAMTGSLRQCPVARLQLEAYFGDIYQVTTYRELLERGYISDAEVKIIMFKYNKNKIKGIVFGGGVKGYRNELEWLSLNEERNNFIANMTTKLDGNILVMVKDVAHGNLLKTLISKYTGRPVKFINGKVKADLRLDAMDEMENTKSGMVIVATLKSFGTGSSIKNVHHMIIADLLKSDETLIQAFGRLLRTHESKDKSILWDLSDDLRQRKNSKKNFSLKHLTFRCEVYDDMEFDYKIYERQLP